jgi:D-tyrosyl-tRNA(Tyr) deacylase
LRFSLLPAQNLLIIYRSSVFSFLRFASYLLLYLQLYDQGILPRRNLPETAGTMRAVVQLVKKAAVSVNGSVISEIGPGLLVLLGIRKNDIPGDARILAEKIAHLRIFPDKSKLMNLSLLDVGGQMLVVSQFTLYGDCRKGRRPSYSNAAPPAQAEELYEVFMRETAELGIRVAAGKFQAMMDVELINQGPVTILLDSAKSF